MTYGVDQCRKCGKPMRIESGEAVAGLQQNAGRKPTMTEQQWRAAGWKAAPTPRQMNNILEGTCSECRIGLVARRPGRQHLFAIIGGVLVCFFGVLAFLLLAGR